jgi:hypothetical protein
LRARVLPLEFFGEGSARKPFEFGIARRIEGFNECNLLGGHKSFSNRL